MTEISKASYVRDTSRVHPMVTSERGSSVKKLSKLPEDASSQVCIHAVSSGGYHREKRKPKTFATLKHKHVSLYYRSQSTTMSMRVSGRGSIVAVHIAHVNVVAKWISTFPRSSWHHQLRNFGPSVSVIHAVYILLRWSTS